MNGVALQEGEGRSYLSRGEDYVYAGPPVVPAQTQNFLRLLDLVISPRVRARYRFSVEVDGWEKQCPGCGEFWPADLEFYHQCMTQTDGLYYYCIACALERKQQVV